MVETRQTYRQIPSDSTLIRRIRKFAPVVFSMLFIGACGVNYWYDHIDFLMKLQIDQYFDLTSQQEDFVELRLGEHHSWHRKEGIPLLIAFLEETKENISDGVEYNEIEAFITAYREQLRIVIDQSADDMLSFLTSLSMEQIDYFEEALDESNKDYKERAALSRKERLELRAERLIEFLEDWVGSLSTEQTQIVIEISKNQPDNYQQWFQRRLNRQKRLIRSLKEQKSNAEIKTLVVKMLLLPDPRKHKALYASFIDTVLKIDRLLNQQQRIHAAEKLQGWIDDIKRISPEG